MIYALITRKSTLLFVTLFFLFTQVLKSQTALNYNIATWYDNKKAAASITFDDCLSGQFTEAAPILNTNNIQATFFIITNNVISQGVGWNLIKNAQILGNEIGNHTASHPTLTTLSVADINHQFALANKDIFDNTQYKTVTMSYPNGGGGGETAADQTVRKVAKSYFIGARSVGGLYNEYNFADNEENYFKVKSPMIFDNTSATEIGISLDNTIRAGGWYCPTYHGIVNGWIVVTKAVFQNHVAEYVKRNDKLWASTFANIVKYHRERKTALLSVVSENEEVWTLALSDTLSNNSLWNQALTINITKPTWNVLSICQNGMNLAYKQIGNQLVFHAIPDEGHIIIRKEATNGLNSIHQNNPGWKLIADYSADTLLIYNLRETGEINIDVLSISGASLRKFESNVINRQVKLTDLNFKKGIYLVHINGKSNRFAF